MAAQTELILRVQALGEEQIVKVQKMLDDLERTTNQWSNAQQRAAMASAGMHEQALKMNDAFDKQNQMLTLSLPTWAAISAAVSTVGYALQKAVTETLDYVESLEKANKQTGITIDFWQKLVQSGAEMDMTIDDIRGAVEKMEKALEGDGKALAKFGIDVENFKNLSPDEALRAMAVQMVAIQDPMVKAAAEMAAFGKSGTGMDRLLRAIVDGSVDLQKVLAPGTVNSLLATKDATEKAETAWKNLTREMVGLVTMSLPVTSTLKNFTSGLELLSVGGQHAGATMKFLAEIPVIGLANATRILYAELEKTAAGMDRSAMTATKATKFELELAEAQRKGTLALQEAREAWEREEKASEKARQAHEKQQKTITALEKEFQRLETTARKYAMDSEDALIKSWKEVDVAAAAHTRQMMQEEEKQLAESRKKWQQMAKAAEGYFNLIDRAARENYSQHRFELEQTALAAEQAYRDMLTAGTATEEQLQQAHEKAAKARAEVTRQEKIDEIKNWEYLASTATGILRNLFGKSKAAAIAAAIIDTIAAVVKTLAAYPWPWSLIPAAAAAAAGYAQVDKIRSQDAGFRTGTPGTSFVDFGRGSMEMLHGHEAIVTRGQADSVAAMVRDAIDAANRRSNGGGQRGGGSGRTGGEGGGDVYLDGQLVGKWFERRNKAGLLKVR